VRWEAVVVLGCSGMVFKVSDYYPCHFRVALALVEANEVQEDKCDLVKTDIVQTLREVFCS
jgi:hypothetical protein